MSATLDDGSPANLSAALSLKLVLLLSRAEAMVRDHPDIAADQIRAAHSMLSCDLRDSERRSRTQTAAPGSLTSSQETLIKSHIAENLASRIDGRQLAAMAGLRHEDFAHAFRVRFGNSLCSYIAEMRMSLAKTMLLETDVAVAEIASKCGSGNEAHFSRTFCRMVGMAPTAWKRQQLDLDAAEASQDGAPLSASGSCSRRCGS